MKTIALVALLVLAAPAYAAVEVPYTEWTVYAETLVNNDDNIEARLGATVDNYWIDLAARDADFLAPAGCRFRVNEELEYEGRMGLMFHASEKVSHGPVVGYTKRAGGADTYSAGYRIVIAGGGK